MFECVNTNFLRKSFLFVLDRFICLFSSSTHRIYTNRSSEVNKNRIEDIRLLSTLVLKVLKHIILLFGYFSWITFGMFINLFSIVLSLKILSNMLKAKRTLESLIFKASWDKPLPWFLSILHYLWFNIEASRGTWVWGEFNLITQFFILDF